MSRLLPGQPPRQSIRNWSSFWLRGVSLTVKDTLRPGIRPEGGVVNGDVLIGHDEDAMEWGKEELV